MAFTLRQPVAVATGSSSPATTIAVSLTQPVTAGSLLVARFFAGGNHPVSSVSGGETWDDPNADIFDAGSSLIDHLYVLSAVGGDSSFTFTFPSDTSGAYAVVVEEWGYSGVVSLDGTIQTNVNTSTAADPLGRALTPSGSTDILFQAIAMNTNPSAIGGGYTFNSVRFGWATGTIANTLDGTAPTWTAPINGQNIVTVGLAFKEVGVGGGDTAFVPPLVGQSHNKIRAFVPLARRWLPTMSPVLQLAVIVDTDPVLLRHPDRIRRPRLRLPQAFRQLKEAVLGTGSQVLTATAAIFTWNAAAATVVATVTIAATAATASWTVPAPTLVPGRATIVATPAVGTWTLPAPTVVPGLATIAATPAVQIWEVPAPSWQNVLNLPANPATMAWTVPAVTVTSPVTIPVAAPATVTWNVPAATLTPGTAFLAVTPAVTTWTVVAAGIQNPRFVAVAGALVNTNSVPPLTGVNTDSISSGDAP